VRFHRGFADDQVGGYLDVGQAAGQAEQDVPFPGGQRFQPGRAGRRGRRR
jgi:hypothetical protein